MIRTPRMRHINVTVPGELVARAKAAGLNLSEVTRTALAQAIETHHSHDAELRDETPPTRGP